MACVTSLSVGLAGSCEAVKKVGGTFKEFWIGSVKDIDAIVLDATDKFIESITMKTGKQMVKITGKLGKNTGAEPIEDEGEGNVAVYVHTVNGVLYHFTQADRNAIEDIVSLDQAFIILPTQAKQFIAYGISKDAETYQNYGLKVSGGDDPTGAAINDLNAQQITATGRMINKAVIFGEGATYADNLTALGVLAAPAV